MSRRTLSAGGVLADVRRVTLNSLMLVISDGAHDNLISPHGQLLMYGSYIGPHISLALSLAYVFHCGHTTNMLDCAVMRDVICGYTVSQH